MLSIWKCACALALAMCFLGAVQAATLQDSPANLNPELMAFDEQLPGETQEETLRRVRSATHWLKAIAGNAAESAKGVPAGSTISDILQLDPLRIDNADGSTTALQMLVLVMTPPASSTQCLPSDSPGVEVSPPEYPAPPPFNPPAPRYQPDQPYEPVPSTTSRPSRRRTRPPGRFPTLGTTTRFVPQPTTPAPQPAPTPAPNVPPPPPAPRPRRSPNFPPVEDSQELLRQFREQVAVNPLLPPVVTEPLSLTPDEATLPDAATNVVNPTLPPAPASSGIPTGDRRTQCIDTCVVRLRARYGGGGVGDPPSSIDPQRSPPLPRFERPMMLQATLTVNSADYSEPYTLWWDSASGASRIDSHGDTASTYRMMRLDGLAQSVHVRVDRTGETDVRRCVVLTPRRISLAERALPVLPDLSDFTFSGYVEVQTSTEKVLVERWVNTVTGQGGIPREVLTYRHELLVIRSPANFTTTPLRYAVAVDSNILGENSDSYFHRFTRVQFRSHDRSMFNLDIGDACETIEKTDDIDVVEPLREFSMLRRLPKYEKEYQQYKKTFERTYADDTEETVRRSALMQASRFMSSGNRKGASFELETNFLSDRLRVEQRALLGATEMMGSRGMPFPHSAEELQGLRGRLPRTFDWRKLGAVTSVRYQGTCASCWAFSVVGAVEGALFVNTGRLVPLSEQTLVDCGQPYRTNGCRPTWPNFAYEYVVDQGLPALDEYPEYMAREQQCRASEVPAITRISGHVNVTSNNLLALKVAIRRHGPTVVLVDAETPSFIAHKSGFYHDAKCKKNVSNHAMLAVGWTVHRGETYFILKNWWSPGWGDGGYINVRGKTNTCGILRLPSYPILRNSDVLRIPASAATAVTPPTDNRL